MRPHRAQLLAVAALAGASLGLAACGGNAASTNAAHTGSVTGGATTGSSASAPSGSSSSSSSSSSTTTISSSGSGPSSTAGAADRCTSTQLTATESSPNGAAGSVGYVVTFTNTSSSGCTLYGYPGMQMLGTDGASLPTQVQRGTSVTVPTVPEATITLDPGGTASFDVGFATSTGYAGDQCPTSASVEITPPNDYNAITVTWAIAPYGGTTEQLQCGDVTVSPVYAGSSQPA